MSAGLELRRAQRAETLALNLASELKEMEVRLKNLHKERDALLEAKERLSILEEAVNKAQDERDEARNLLVQVTEQRLQLEAQLTEMTLLAAERQEISERDQDPS